MRRHAISAASSLGSTRVDPARNVELKAHDPDPARTLERARAPGGGGAGGARPRGTHLAPPPRAPPPPTADPTPPARPPPPRAGPARAAGARDEGLLRQRDTYFAVPQ